MTRFLTARDYRARAEEWRVVAENTQDKSAREVLLAVASSMDRMAAFADTMDGEHER